MAAAPTRDRRIMSADGRRCDHRISEVRCELVAHHKSMHAARHNDMILHWRDPHMSEEAARRVALEWADDLPAG